MSTYRVEWTAEIEASDPLQAALSAREAFEDSDESSFGFDVYNVNTSECTRIDLSSMTDLIACDMCGFSLDRNDQDTIDGLCGDCARDARDTVEDSDAVEAESWSPEPVTVKPVEIYDEA